MFTLIPLNKSNTVYVGIVEINEDTFHVQVEKSKLATRFSCDWRLKHKLKKHLKLLELRLKQCENIFQFFDEIELLIKACFVEDVSRVWHAKYYDILLQHLHDLGWDKVQNVSDDFHVITLNVLDAKERDHSINLKLNFDYPLSVPEVSVTLPLLFEPLWTSDSDLVVLYSQFKLFLNQFERFWDEVDELHENTWILEPESPNYAATCFRIALDKTSSLAIKVDPLNMGIAPECNFLGAEWSVSSLREKFHERHEDWNECLSLYRNLKIILDVHFPAKASLDKPDFSLHCGICYAFRLGVSIPDQICNDKRCGQPFHHECLSEWLRSIPGTKQSFNVIFGECPYCTSPIKLNVLLS